MALLEKLLEANGLSKDEIEPNALAHVMNNDQSNNNEEAIHRLIRFTLTNRELRKHGLPPLSLRDDNAGGDDKGSIAEAPDQTAAPHRVCGEQKRLGR